MATMIKAEQKYSGISPRKVRWVVRGLRGLPVTEVINRLEMTDTLGAKELLKVVNQAKANAVKNLRLGEVGLKLHGIEVGEGPRYKRWQPVSRGRAHALVHQTCHIKVVLKTQEENGPKS